MTSTQQSRPGEGTEAAEAFAGAEVTIPDSTTRCLECRRQLADPASIARGYGPTCYARQHVQQRVGLVRSARQRLDRLASILDRLDTRLLTLIDAQLTDLDDTLTSLEAGWLV